MEGGGNDSKKPLWKRILMKNNFLRAVDRRKLSKFFKGGGERRRQNIFKGGGMKKNNIWGWGRGEKKKNIFVLKDRYLEDGSASQYQALRMRRFDFYKLFAVTENKWSFDCSVSIATYYEEYLAC